MKYPEDYINKIICGDCIDILRGIPNASVNCCVTSPPYYGLRDYGCAAQVGLEPRYQDYVQKLVEIFHEIKRILKDDGTCWLNLGDSYATKHAHGTTDKSMGWKSGEMGGEAQRNHARANGGDIESKNLMGIPWRVAFALQADGWYLRQDIIWAKPNPMPESVTDRCTKSHEYIFLLSKSSSYYFNHKAIQEEATGYDGRKDTVHKGSPKYAMGKYLAGGNANSLSIKGRERWKRKNDDTNHGGNGNGFKDHSGYNNLDNPYIRNKRSVWTVTTKPCALAHFATFPEDLILDCVLAGCPQGGVVIDPFMGSGTTGLVSKKNGCNYIGCELNPEYVEIAQRRLAQEYMFT